MMAVSGGWVDRLCFLAIVPRNLLRLTSFLGCEESLEDSYSWIRAFAMSEHARMNRSFSGTCFAIFLAFRFVFVGVIVMVAMVKRISPRRGGKTWKESEDEAVELGWWGYKNCGRRGLRPNSTRIRLSKRLSRAKTPGRATRSLHHTRILFSPFILLNTSPLYLSQCRPSAVTLSRPSASSVPPSAGLRPPLPTNPP